MSMSWEWERDWKRKTFVGKTSDGRWVEVQSVKNGDSIAVSVVCDYRTLWEGTIDEFVSLAEGVAHESEDASQDQRQDCRDGVQDGEGGSVDG